MFSADAQGLIDNFGPPALQMLLEAIQQYYNWIQKKIKIIIEYANYFL